MITVIKEQIPEIKNLLSIDRKNYTPKPNFDTSFILFSRRKKPIFSNKQELMFKDFLTYTFERRHAELGKALKQVMSSLQIKVMCKELNIEKEKNIKEIAFEGWVKMFHIFYKHTPQTSKNKIYGKYKKLLEDQKGLIKRHRTYKD